MRFAIRRSSTSTNRGSALLAVLWLSAALAAIAFTVASTVRGETERVATGDDDLRAYYLAQGAVQDAILRVQWGNRKQGDGSTPYFTPGQPLLYVHFPTGDASVEVIPETSKIDLNQARPDLLERLMLVLGAAPDQAGVIAAAITDWRTPSARPTAFDEVYASLRPSFRAAHASFHDVEELLFVQGMTADLFHGTWVRTGEGGESRLVPRGGVRDCVSPFGSTNRFDVNTAPRAVLLAIGMPPEAVDALLARRSVAPLLTSQELADFAGSDAVLLNHLTIAPHTIYTFRATARLRRADGSLGDLRRMVSALVKLMPQGSPKPFHILRWYDRG